jgi:dihydrofolate reductase
LSEDLKQFKELTTGHPIIMGRKTFESIGKALPDRLNIVVTSDESFEAEGCVISHSLDDAIETAKLQDQDKIFIIGGAKVYQESIAVANRLYLTVVEGEFEADAFFPDHSEFKKIVSEQTGESNGLRYKFIELER